MKKIIITAMAALALAGCAGGRAYFTVAGVPGSSKLLKQKTVTTSIDPKANLLTRNLEKNLIAELKRGQYKYTPGKADITIQANAYYGGRGSGKSTTYLPIVPLGGAYTYTEQFDVINLDFQAIENNEPIWEARISGAGDTVLEMQGGCIRELLINHTSDAASREDRCYKDHWPPK